MKRVEDLKRMREGKEVNQDLKEIIPEMQYCNIRGKLNNGFIKVKDEGGNEGNSGNGGNEIGEDVEYIEDEV